MKNQFRLLAVAMLFAWPAFAQLNIDDGVMLDRTVINSAGYKETKGSITLEYSIGEMLAIRSFDNDTLRLSMGYLQYFDSKKLPENSNESELQLFPTLVTNSFNLKGRINPALPFQLVMYDVQGRKIHQLRFIHPGGPVWQTVPTPFLRSGLYIVSIEIPATQSSPSETKTFRIIKL